MFDFLFCCHVLRSRNREIRDDDMTTTKDSIDGNDAFSERTAQTLANIQSLQKTEHELFIGLEKNELSNAERARIMEKINEIAQLRLNLYATLKDINSAYGINLTNSAALNKQQLFALDVVERQLNEAKARMNALETERNNTLRMVEINTYYGKQYGAQAQLMRTIALGCIPILLFSVLYSKDILSGKIYGLCVTIVLVILIFMVGKQWLDMRNRSDMNYDEYNWYFNPETAPSSTSGGTSGGETEDVWAETPTVGCTGEACCFEGTKWDGKACVVSTSS